MADDTVDSIPDVELVRRAVLYCKPRVGQPKWAAVSKAFGLGSAYSQQLCVKHGIDPDGNGKP